MIALTREEAQQVLDALIWTLGSDDFSEAGKARTGAVKLLLPATELLHSRLSAPEPEPVAWMYEYGTDHGDAVNQIFWHKNLRLEKPDGMVRNVVPLYTAPPQREWQGLTDEEIRQGNRESWVTIQAWQSAVWWAEEKLKEKNG
jgi:hypothetical protein